MTRMRLAMWARRAAFWGAATAISLAGMACLADRMMPPDLARLEAPSQIVTDRHGAMLRAFMTRDRQWRLAAEPGEVSPLYLKLLTGVEDKHFWVHPGVDPLALLRAAGQIVTHGRIVSGGSTLTMQVARLLEPRQRTFVNKLLQIGRALQLEARFNKQDILAAYLTLTPMGGNLQGVRAGALAWFGKEPAHLNAAEAALLVALPQAPRLTRPDAPGSRAGAARAKVLAIAARDGLMDEAALKDALVAPLPDRRIALPVLAPHLAERLAEEPLSPSAAAPSPTVPIRTSLDRNLQQNLQRLLHQTLDELPKPTNLAAIVADWHSGEILSEAGSGDYFDASRRGAIDMTRAIRSPGSTLKPFIYGMAFDRLLAHPGSLVRDEPTRFDDYAPHNFNGGFNGDVTIRQALQASLNLPAVIVLQRLGPVAFAGQFKQAGLPLAFGDDSVAPSLPLALGGAGMSLHGLVTAYAALASGGVVRPLTERLGAARPEATGTGLMSAPAAAAVTDILRAMPAPRGVAKRANAIAYKTGTSYRFRDGWAVGFDGTHVAGVWMGRADGGTCAGCVGQAAAGILVRLFDLMAPEPLPQPELTPFFAGPPPPSLTRLVPMTPRPAPDAPHISFPPGGAKLLTDADGDAIKLVAAGGQRPYRWLVDGKPLPSSSFAREAAWHPESEGFSTVTVIDARGLADEVKVRIEARAQ